MRKKLLCLFGVLVCTVSSLMAQISNTYQFTSSTGTYTALSGSTPISLSYNGSANSDDGYASIPIGFTFNYAGTNYTNVNVDANGWASFGAAVANNTDTWDNNLSSGLGASRPVLAPLWDDLYTDPGTVSYLLSGVSPNRTLTVEWKNIYWTWAAATPVMSFQVVLHETTNIVDFVYQQGATAYGDDGTHGASIGISGVGTGSGNFMSVTPNGLLTAASTTTENGSITTKPASGQIYSFVPYCSAGIQPTYIGNSESISRVRIGTIDQSTPALPPTAYHNYTNLSTFAQAAATIPLTMNLANVYSLDQVYVWIDYNHNGSFTDPGEEVYISSLPLGSATLTANIAIPAASANVLLGPTRMRIRLNDTGSPPDNSTPCGSGGLFGDVQDFTVNIQNCIAVLVLASPPSTLSLCNAGNGSISGLSAIGTGLAYIWQVSTDGGVTYNNLTNTAPYSGVTTGTLGLTAVTPALNGYKYRVVMTGTCTTGFLTSTPTTLTVNTAATVATQPANASACQGSNATFTIAATGTSPTYQWQVSTDGGTTYNNVSATATTGGTSNSLTVGPVTPAMNNNKFRCVVTVASCGSVNSNAATLTVDTNPAPTLSVSASATQLQPGVLSTVSASPTVAGVSYSWNFNGTTLAGATTSSITVNAAGTGTYSAFVTDAAACKYASTNSVTITAIASDKLWIYPNPAQGGQFHVQLYSPWLSDVRTLTITNAAGVIVARKQFEVTSPYVSMDFNLAAAGAGVYTVKVDHKYVEHQPTSEVIGKVVIP